MNLELSEEQELLQKTTRRFLETETPPTRVRELSDTDEGFERAWWRRVAELGATSMLVPEEQGGGSVSGSPLQDLVIVAEEVGRMVSPGPFLPVNVVASALAESGSAEQKDNVLPGLASGEIVATWAFAEPGGGWDKGAGGLTIDRSNNNQLFLRGRKTHVEAATIADYFLVTGHTGTRLTQVLVPAITDGVVVTPGRSIDLVRRFGEVSFEGVQIPASTIVGEVGGAEEDVEHQLQIALVLQCAESVGAADRVFEFTLDYAQNRYAFGRPIASFQALKHRIADMLVWLESAKGTSDATAAAVDSQAEDAPILVSVAKAFIGQRTVDIVSDCTQIHGGIGVTWEHDLHLYNRRVTLNRALFGTPEEHKARLHGLLRK